MSESEREEVRGAFIEFTAAFLRLSVRRIQGRLLLHLCNSLMKRAMIVSLCFIDNRCFLIGGGSAETFFISENATVGSVIGMRPCPFLFFFI